MARSNTLQPFLLTLSMTHLPPLMWTSYLEAPYDDVPLIKFRVSCFKSWVSRLNWITVVHTLPGGLPSPQRRRRDIGGGKRGVPRPRLQQRPHLGLHHFGRRLGVRQ